MLTFSRKMVVTFFPLLLLLLKSCCRTCFETLELFHQELRRTSKWNESVAIIYPKIWLTTVVSTKLQDLVRTNGCLHRK